MTEIKHIGDDVYNLISWFDFEKVKNAKVFVIGVGALGNEVLKNLALLGVGNIVIVDFDRIERSNLCRSILFRPGDVDENKLKCEIAATRVNEINPDINVNWVNGDIQKEVGLGYFRWADVVIGCLDNRLARYVVNDYAFKFKKSWIDAGIQNLEGNASVYEFGKSCYACSLSDFEKSNLSYRFGCYDVVQFNHKYGRIATTPITASILGAVQVQEALKIIHGFKDGQLIEDHEVCSSLSGRLFKYEGMNLDVYTPPFNYYYSDCHHHEAWGPIIADADLTNTLLVAEFIELVESDTNDKIVGFHLRNSFVPEIVIEPSGRKLETLLPETKIVQFILEQDLFPCDGGKIVKLPSPDGGYRFITRDFHWKNFTLAQIGIPEYDVIKVVGEKSDYYFELSGNYPFI